MPMLLRFFLFTLFAAILGHGGDVCGIEYFPNGGFELPKVPSGSSSFDGGLQGWESVAETRPAVWSRGYKDIEPAEGDQALMFSRGKEIIKTLNVKKGDFVVIALKYMALSKIAGLLVEADSPSLSETILTLKGNTAEGTWKEGNALYESTVKGSLSIKLLGFSMDTEDGMLVDELKLAVLDFTMTTEPLSEVHVGDFVVVTTTLAHRLSASTKVQIAINFGPQMSCVTPEDHGGVLGGYTCESSRAQFSYVNLSCGKPATFRFVAKPLRQGNAKLIPTLNMNVDGVSLMTLGSATNFYIGGMPDLQPNKSALIVNGDFETPLLHGLDFVNVGGFDIPGWQSDRRLGLWRDGKEGIAAIVNYQFVKLSPSQTLYQDFDVTGVSKVFWSLRHRGLKGDVTFVVKMGPLSSPTVQLEVDSTLGQWTIAESSYLPSGTESPLRVEITSIGELLFDDIKVSAAPIDPTLPTVTPTTTAASTSGATDVPAPVSTSQDTSCSPNNYNGGFESPVVLSGSYQKGVVEGWDGTGSHPVELWSRGYNDFEPAEGAQALYLPGSSKISREFAAEGGKWSKAYVAYSFKYRAERDQGVINVLLGSGGKETTDAKIFVKGNSWSQRHGVATVSGGYPMRFTIASLISPGVMIDDLKVTVASVQRVVDTLAEVHKGDVFKVTTTLNVGEIEGLTWSIFDTHTNGLGCVSSDGNVKPVQGDLMPGTASSCKSPQVTIGTTKLGCREEFIAEYTLTAVGEGVHSIAPLASMVFEGGANAVIGDKFSFQINDRILPGVSDEQLFSNGGFELPHLNGLESVNVEEAWRWRFTPGEGEIWLSGKEGIQATEGTQFVKLSPSQKLFEDLKIPSGSKISWSLKHRGFKKDAKLAVNIGSTKSPIRQQDTEGRVGEWQTMTGEYTVPATHITTRFEIVAMQSDGEVLIDDVKAAITGKDDSIDELPPCDCSCCL